MQRKVLFVVCATLLTGCSTKTYYSKPNGSQQAFNQDIYTCRQQNSYVSSGSSFTTLNVVGNFGTAHTTNNTSVQVDRDGFNYCMRAKGYSISTRDKNSSVSKTYHTDIPSTQPVLSDYLPKAKAGDQYAQMYVGWMYEKAKGVPKDYSKALEWYTKSANQGNASAQVSLGELHEYGRGVPVNKKEANYWYEKAAEQGNQDAKMKLGLINFFD